MLLVHFITRKMRQFLPFLWIIQQVNQCAFVERSFYLCVMFFNTFIAATLMNLRMMTHRQQHFIMIFVLLKSRSIDWVFYPPKIGILAVKMMKNIQAFAHVICNRFATVLQEFHFLEYLLHPRDSSNVIPRIFTGLNDSFKFRIATDQ
jgi:hypothetical protein